MARNAGSLPGDRLITRLERSASCWAMGFDLTNACFKSRKPEMEKGVAVCSILTIQKPMLNVSNWSLCAGPGSAGLQRIAAPLPDVHDQWVLIVQRHLIREQRKHIRLTYCMHASQVIAGQL